LQGILSLTWKAQFSLRRTPLLLAMLLAVPVLALLTGKNDATRPFFHWVVNFYFTLLLPLYCLAACGAMIRDELQADTLRFLITRPLPRWQLLVIQYLCHTLRVQVLGLVSGCLLLTVGFIRHIPDLWSFAWLFLGTQILAVLAYAALSSLLGLINQRYILLGILYGAAVEMGIGRIPTNINNLSISRHLRTLLANHETIRDLYEWSPDGTLKSVGLLLVATVVFVAAAALLFAHREYHAAEEMQK
jgi:ABC-type transport system involved in multi-copper enzyme maturation permease subunit